MNRPTARRRTPAVLAVSSVTAAGCMAIAVALGVSATSHPAPSDFGTAPTAAPAPAAPNETRPGAVAASPPATQSPQTSLDRSPATPAGLLPARLLIPRLGVDAPVDAVGVAADGTVAIPERPEQVGWYRYGPRPGDRAGSAVIVGHVDFATGRLGVLAVLNSLREGDRIQVQDAQGHQLAFTVQSRASVPKARLAASGAFRRDGEPVLTLITCTGPYVKGRGGYQDNLVVTAVAEHP